MYLYLWINILWFIAMLVLTFNKRIQFYHHLKTIIPSIFFVDALFMLWNHYFTTIGVWGFNTHNLCGIAFSSIPLEEWMLFFIFPYTAIFFLYSFESYFPEIKYTRFNGFFAVIFTLVALLLAIVYRENKYTLVVMSLAGLLNGIVYFGYTPRWYAYFTNTFLSFYVLFLILNGVVSKYMVDYPIVWYDPHQIIGWEIINIPIENIFFYFLLFMETTLTHQGLKKGLEKVTHKKKSTL